MRGKRIRELLFQVGLVFGAVVLGKVFDFPLGYVVAAVLAIAFVAQWLLQREEGEQELELQTIFDEPVPWAEAKESPVKPQIDWWTWSFPEVEYDQGNGMWAEYSGKYPYKTKGFALHITNNLDDTKKKGAHARVRAQIWWTYDTGATGPRFSPAHWIGEEFGEVELPVGVTKRLLVATRSLDGNYWNGSSNSRLKPEQRMQGASDVLPFLGTMLIKLIGSNDELLAEAKWSWREDVHTHWPMVRPLSPVQR